MELELVNQELSESKLADLQVSRLLVEILQIYYTCKHQVYNFSKDNEQQDYAVAYARKSTAYGPIV